MKALEALDMIVKYVTLQCYRLIVKIVIMIVELQI